MKAQLEQIQDEALLAMDECTDLKELDGLRVRFLGKKGELTLILKQMGKLTPEERKEVGQLANAIRGKLEEKITVRQAVLKKEALEKSLIEEQLDTTLPGKEIAIGKKHPLTIVLDEIKGIFLGMGFDIADGPEVETDYYNFEALNIPKDHPARDTQDTFYMENGLVLRSQTSPVQIRYMEKNKPPIRVIAPGRVYRSDTVDATHSPLFNQVEGLVVDKGVRMSDLKGVLEVLAKSLYGEDAQVRFRPHHFQFTEPSAEMDVMCFNCHGKGCGVCKREGWIEILGCGMVHPKVLEYGGINPDEYTGFAFGMGLERVVMRRYTINDLRLFYENDLRFLDQF